MEMENVLIVVILAVNSLLDVGKVMNSDAMNVLMIMNM